MYNNREYEKTNITTTATTVIFSGRGTLGNIVINSAGTGGTIAITDRTSPVTTIGTIALTGSPVVTLEYNCIVSSSLQIVTSGSPDITVMWTRG